MTEHVLDRPMWHALTTRQAEHAVKEGPALRYQTDIGPLAGIPDQSVDSLTALGTLIQRLGNVALAGKVVPQCPPGARFIHEGRYFQMLWEGPAPEGEPMIDIVRLGADDALDMVALTTLTNPGPFGSRTYVLGDYWGVRVDGILAAMAGERMKQNGYSEISAVCTHPDHLGKGYARALCRTLVKNTLERGDTPYLHVHDINERAVKLYEHLGFRIRETMNVAFAEPI